MKVSSRGPYLVRIEDDEYIADDLGSAMEAAVDMYDASRPIPEIIDADGALVFDPYEIVDRIIERRS